jgi:dTDP-glucose 4,6-dehydratase
MGATSSIPEPCASAASSTGESAVPKRRALVSGGAGFLGSHLCERLLGDGWQVVCVDNLVTGAAHNIRHLERDRSFESIQHNVSEPLYLDGPIDAVLHFASPASPVDYADHPIATLKVGTLGTHNMLGLARAKGSVFLLASTSEVYGDPTVHPQPETYWGNVNPVGPRAVYDESKRAAEAFTMAYHRTHGMKTRIVRIFNTYGPRMRLNDGRAVPNFLLQALSNKPLTVYGDGSQTRSLCYVDDLVEGVLDLLGTNYAQPVNLGNADEVTILQLAHRIRDLCGSASEIVFKDLPEDDPKQRQPDLSRARQILGFQPHTSLEEGLGKTIAYFRDRLQKSA